MSHLLFTMTLTILLSVTICGCTSTPKSEDRTDVTQASAEPAYPAHWWTPVDVKSAPEWEILPQAAQPGEVVLSKRHELGLLSNFAATPFEYRGKRYASVEGFWQSLLYPESPSDPRATAKGVHWPHTRAEVEQMVAFEAKRAGGPAKKNMKQMGIDWVTFEGQKMTYWTKEAGAHYRLIRDVLRAKAEQNANVRAALLATGNLKLLPDHQTDPDAAPAWRYNEIWMELREEFRRRM